MSTPTVSIIIPVYNEKHTIAKLLDRVHEATARLSAEIILVDDASTDGTAQVLSTLTSKNVQVYTHDRNQGKGAAIRTGIAHVTGEIIIIQDADLEYHPRDYPTLLEPILEGEADVVFGNRFHGGTHRVLYVHL
jgi:glycosyltransferase involved in cell wall biosynthesis